jgi:cation transport ATPase
MPEATLLPSLSFFSPSRIPQSRVGPVTLPWHVADALRIAPKAKRLMRENLWLAVIYNAIAVPIAITGLATQLVAVIAMSGSSLLVTADALRARRAG